MRTFGDFRCLHGLGAHLLLLSNVNIDERLLRQLPGQVPRESGDALELHMQCSGPTVHKTRVEQGGIGSLSSGAQPSFPREFIF